MRHRLTMVQQNKTDSGFCRGHYARFAGVMLLLVSALATVPCAGTTIRAKTDMRLWETVHDRTERLTWPWAEGADSAELTFSNRVTGACLSMTDSRVADARRGSCDQASVYPSDPLARTNAETLVDVTLVQKAGGNEIARESATLAYVNGAGGGPITVRTMGTPEREMAKLREPRVYAFDPAWLGEAGDSGYAIAWPPYIGMFFIFR